MPSSHALSLAYLSTYACAAVLSAHPADTAGYPLAGVRNHPEQRERCARTSVRLCSD